MAIRFRQRIAIFAPERLEPITKVLADTKNGLTGSEIANMLAQCRIPDVDPTNTKWKRLFNAFVTFQNEHKVGNHVVMFINRTLDPARYTSAPDTFVQRREALNPILVLCGMSVGDDGKVRNAAKASTLSDALERANRFKEKLRQRNVHSDVLKYCSAEILAQNYFHSVFEAMKSITAKIRALSGLDSDGHRLVDDAFSFGGTRIPVLAINPLETETQRGEQRGFVSLLKGLCGTVRNPLAHEPRAEWEMSEQDALDIMTMISLVHRKLDKATARQSKGDRA